MEAGGRGAGNPWVVSTFVWGGFFVVVAVWRTVRESYQGFHFRDFVVVVVIFSKTASMRGPFHFSRLRASTPRRRFCDCNQRRRAFRAMYPPACAAHALSCMSALLLCFPITFIYLRYLYQCASCSLLLCFWGFLVIFFFKHEPQTTPKNCD